MSQLNTLLEHASPTLARLSNLIGEEVRRWLIRPVGHQFLWGSLCYVRTVTAADKRPGPNRPMPASYGLRMLGALNDTAVALLLGIGHRLDMHRR